MPCEREQRRVEANGVALALEDGALQVVVQDDLRGSAEVAEGLDMAAEKARHRRAHREVHEAVPAEGEHHDEGEEITLRTTDDDLTEVGPVDLGLLAGEHGPAHVRLGVTARTEPADDGAKTAL